MSNATLFGLILAGMVCWIWGFIEVLKWSDKRSYGSFRPGMLYLLATTLLLALAGWLK